MYKCLVCGHIFARGEEAEWTEAHGERWTGCPVCKSSYEETVRCGHCSGEHLEDELYGGWCMECIAEAITVDNVLSFVRENDIECDLYSEFYQSSIDGISQALDALLGDNIKRLHRLDQMSGTDNTIVWLRKYIVAGEENMAMFVDYLNEMEEIKK